ncbi:MAG: hypothetical protein HYX48_03865 [Chlamydiales bacterium]|nr:hypothetical protein [Chlamydiales bacterium]
MSKRRKLLIVLCAFTVCLSAGALFLGIKKPSQAQAQIQKSGAEDFESLMGRGSPSWSYIQTKEDFENLRFFKALYDSKKSLLSEKSQRENRIPNTLHLIWLGPKPFPRESVENVRGWIAKHPGWTINFWTDRERPLPCPGMKLKLVRDFNFLMLESCYHKTDNYGEKSDVLRYEILYQEGGVYVDHDVKCFKSFDSMNLAYNFYCGMDMPYMSSLPSCVFPTNNLIGISPGHPILKTCMTSLKKEWDQIEKDYPGTARDEVLNRVLHRTFLLFGNAIKESNNQEGRQDIVFPAFYFDAPTEKEAMWAYHLYAGQWFEDESKFEKMVRERLMVITKKSNKLFLVVGAIGALNLIGLSILFTLFYKKRHVL